MSSDDVTASVPVPADIDLTDKILFGLTARQVGMLVPVAAALLTAWHMWGDKLPTIGFVAACAPIAATAVVLVLGRRDGTSLDRLAWAAVRQPRHKLAPGAATAPFSLQVRGARAPAVKQLTGPVRAISATATGVGILDLGSAGVAIGLNASTVNFGLRSGAEQMMLVAGFARVLHSVSGHLQIVVATQPVDLAEHITRVRRTVKTHPDRAVTRAGRAYVAWLEDLTIQQGLVRRQVTIMARAATASAAERFASHIADASAACGISVTALTPGELAQRIRHGVDPYTARAGAA